jgi:Flp pilus assembly protein TadB
MWFLPLLALSIVVGSIVYSRRLAGHDEIVSILATEESEVDLSLSPKSLSNERRISRTQIYYWIAGAVLFVSFRGLTSSAQPLELVLFSGLGGLAGEMFFRRAKGVRSRREIRKMEFYLPVVMERIVMAVSAGLDVLPAMAEASKGGVDPISKLFERVVELAGKGITVEYSLRTLANQSNCPALKHAFVHLALAHKEGGELVRPLRELSDATQSYYQETVEEEIARLPVKAVLPLVLTFTGLIICFLTVPLIQVSSLTSKVTQGGFE